MSKEIDAIVQLGTLLTQETDRGCVLVASAYLEEMLRTVLMAKCRTLSDVTDDDLPKLFKSFDSQFASFASCIRLARALGIVNEQEKKMLLNFGYKRNEFAHGTGDKKITDHWMNDFVPQLMDHIQRVLEQHTAWDTRLTRERLVFGLWASIMYGRLARTVAILEDQGNGQSP